MSTYNKPSSQYQPAQKGSAMSNSAFSSTAVSPLSRRSIDLWDLWKQITKTLRGQFSALAALLFLFSLVIALSISGTFRQANSDLDTINNGSIPSINAAQAIAQYIDDIDAKSADYLATTALTTTEQCTLVGNNGNVGNIRVHDCDDINIDRETILVNQEIYNAAHNVTYPGERTAIERILAGFNEYSAQIAVMRHEYTLAANKSDPKDAHIIKARQAYQAANDVLQKHITLLPLTDNSGKPVFNETNLPTCQLSGETVQPEQWTKGSIQDNVDCLSFINSSHLQAAYDDTANFLDGSTWAAVLFCLGLITLLALGTVRMAMLTHRIINIGLSLALLICVIFSFMIMGNLTALAGTNGSFHQLVKDDYDSIFAAAQLKRYATDANADESRWLIAKAFNDQTDADKWEQDWHQQTDRVNSLIQAATNNRTWSEEDQPLSDIRNNWNQYFDIDRQIRTVANDTTNTNRIANAEALSTGTSNRAFDTFSQAVDHLALANQSHYNDTYAYTMSALNFYMTACLIFFPIFGLLAVWGIWQRLKDF